MGPSLSVSFPGGKPYPTHSSNLGGRARPWLSDVGTDVPCPQDYQHHQSGTLLSHPLTGTHTAVPRPLRPASAFSKASESVLATWKTRGQQVNDRFGAGINQRGVQAELGRVWPRVKRVKTEGFVVISSQCPWTLSLPTMASGHQVLQTGRGKRK